MDLDRGGLTFSLTSSMLMVEGSVLSCKISFPFVVTPESGTVKRGLTRRSSR